MEEKDKDMLLWIAKASILSAFGREKPPLKEAERFREEKGAFVTLEKNGLLRGCIGYILPVKPLGEAVMDNAISAAFRDPRFPPLSEEELKDLEVEVSILSPPQKVHFNSPEELLEKLKPGVHGVILKRGPYSATFLPQVWEQIPDKVEFLRHLSVKAGLPPDAWKLPGTEIYVYTVEAFKKRWDEIKPPR